MKFRNLCFFFGAPPPGGGIEPGSSNSLAGGDGGVGGVGAAAVGFTIGDGGVGVELGGVVCVFGPRLSGVGGTCVGKVDDPIVGVAGLVEDLFVGCGTADGFEPGRFTGILISLGLVGVLPGRGTLISARNRYGDGKGTGFNCG